MKERPILFNADMVRAILDGRKTQTRRPLNIKPWKDCGGGEFRQSWATVWGGVWHTWDADGVGGENYVETDAENAKPAALESALKQGFIPCPFGLTGDRLWVRETFVLENTYEYHGDHHVPDDSRPIKTGSCPEGCDYLLIPHYRATEKEPHIVPYGAALDDENDDRTRWTPSIHMPRWASRMTLEITNIRVERVQDITEADAFAEGLTHIDYKGDSWGFSGGNPTGYGSAIGAYQALWNSLYGNWAENPWVWVVEFKRIEPAQ